MAFPLPAQFFIGDPSALYPTVHGSYNNPGSADVAYKISGPFPHATTFSFTTYDDVMDVTGRTISSTTIRSFRTQGQ